MRYSRFAAAVFAVALGGAAAMASTVEADFTGSAVSGGGIGGADFSAFGKSATSSGPGAGVYAYMFGSANDAPINLAQPSSADPINPVKLGRVTYSNCEWVPQSKDCELTVGERIVRISLSGVSFSKVATVPLPAGLGMLGASLALLALVTRRRRTALAAA